MEDSGSRDTFDTGCVRDNGEQKSRPDLISPFAKLRLGDWLRQGAEKYDERNWEKGMPIGRCLESIDRHYCQYQMGLTNEDHMAAIMCNAMFIMHYEEMIKIGNLPPSIDNRPSYAPMPIPLKRLAAPVISVSELERAKDDKFMEAAQEATDRRLGPENPMGLNPILVDHSTYGGKTVSEMVKLVQKTYVSDDICDDCPSCECGGCPNYKKPLVLPDDNLANFPD